MSAPISVRKRKFDEVIPPTQPDPGDLMDLMKKNNNILNDILCKINHISERLDNLEKKIPEKHECLAQHKTTRQCKVLLKKVVSSVTRMTGEATDDLQLEVQALFPLSTMDACHDVEERLETEEFASAVKTYLYGIKGSTGSLAYVMRNIITDELLSYFNWSGVWEKRALKKCHLFNEILYDVFGSEGRLCFETQMKKSVENARNRFKQKKLKQKQQFNAPLDEQ